MKKTIPFYCKDTRRNILEYYDNGVSIDSLEQTLRALEYVLDLDRYKLVVVGATYLRSNFIRWEGKTDLIVVPGGRSLPYYKALGKRGNRRIVNYVKRGGKYLGICAGGYYGAAHTVFEKGGELEVVIDGSLNFYKGTAEGPAYGLGEFKYNTERGAHIARIAIDMDSVTKEYDVYFNGGGYFYGGVDEDTTVLARYIELDNKPPAIILCKVGAGSAILSGVHFEYQSEAFRFQKPSGHWIGEKLKSTEGDRIFFFAQLMKRLGLVVKQM